MKINRIECSGFMGYVEPAFIEPSNLTILCGENGTGKSTWFNILRMIRDSVIYDQSIAQPTTAGLVGGRPEDPEFDEFLPNNQSGTVVEPDVGQIHLRVPLEIKILMQTDLSFEGVLRAGKVTRDTADGNVVELSWVHRRDTESSDSSTSDERVFLASIYDKTGERLLLQVQFKNFEIQYVDCIATSNSSSPEPKKLHAVEWTFGERGLHLHEPDKIAEAIGKFFKLLFGEFSRSIFHLSSVRNPLTKDAFKYKGERMCDDRWVGAQGEKAAMQLILHSCEPVSTAASPGTEQGETVTLGERVGELMNKLTGVRPTLLRYPCNDAGGCEEIEPDRDLFGVGTIDHSTGFGYYNSYNGGDLRGLFRPEPAQSNSVFPDSGTVPASNMSTGFQQLLPIVVQLCLLREHDLFLLENPEVHLHPKLQLDLTEIIINEVKRGKHIMIETHSDVLVRRVLRRLLESQLPGDLVKIYFSKIERTKGDVLHFSKRSEKATKEDFAAAVEDMKQQLAAGGGEVKELRRGEDAACLRCQGKTSVIEELSAQAVKEGRINFPEHFLSDSDNEIEALSRIRLRSGMGFPNEGRATEDLIREAIETAQSDTLELKATLRKPLEEGTKEEVEFAWIKTLPAFLNTKGGTLLVGVKNDGEVLGLGSDGFESLDRMNQHLDNLIDRDLGRPVREYLKIKIEAVQGKEVLRIDCRPNRVPVYSENPKHKDEFYIRETGRSISLSPKDAVAYVQIHFRSLSM